MASNEEKARIVEEIIRMEKARVEAITTANPAALDRIFHDDLVYMTALGNRVIGKAQYLKERLDPKAARYHDMAFSNVRIRVFGDDTAIVSGDWLNHITHRLEGERIESMRFTNVWVKENGEWRAVHCQNTRWSDDMQRLSRSGPNGGPGMR